MTLQQLRSRGHRLGYGISLNQRDAWGRKWRYRTSPTQGGGTTCYHDSLEQVARRFANAEQIRGWEAEMPPMPCLCAYPLPCQCRGLAPKGAD